MPDIVFEYPWVLLFLLLFIACSRYCQAKSEAILFPHLDIFMKNEMGSSWWLKLMKWLAVVFTLVALASPVTEDQMEVEKKEGYAISLILDASGSMKYGFSGGMRGLQAGQTAKFDISMSLARDFVQKRKNDQIGLVVFGNFAYVAAPLTYDEKVLEEIMQSLYAGIAGSSQTVINDALFQSAKLFSKSKAKTKIAILLTDGQTRGDNIPFDVAMNLVKKYGVKVYTIGIGEYRDFDGKHLKSIAQISGGLFFSANSKEDLQAVYERIDELEKSKIESEKYVKKTYFFEYPLFLAFLALLFYTFLRNKRGDVT